MRSMAAKRVFDVAVAGAVLVLASPVLLLAGAAVRLGMGPPIFFRQVRPGKHERPFTLYKMRTMREAHGPDGKSVSDAERLTRLGRFLRRTTIDELPQLWNVLRGDMSLVGPRPLLMEYLEHYTPRHRRRFEVRPGMTGWAIVHGRQDIPFSRRLELDVWYVEHGSMRVDLRILWATARNVLRGSGVRPGQDVRDVDDLGLHPEARKARGLAK